MKKEVTKGALTDLESNDIPSSTSLSKAPDLPLGHFTGPAH